jgi:hypothetical protein
MSQLTNVQKSSSTRVSRISVEVRDIPQASIRRATQAQIDADGDGGDMSNE